MQLAFDLVRIKAKDNHMLCRGRRILVWVGAAARNAVVPAQAQRLMQRAKATLASDYEKAAVRAT